MTTATTNAPIDHTSDAGFRLWVIDFHTLIAAAGLVQTADTGQINTATVTKPGAGNTMAGYSIWRLPDSSLYFKFQFGNGNSVTIPQWQLQVGEGSNGSGTLTGQTSTNANMGANGSSTASTVANYTSYCCVTNDFFGIVFKYGSTSGASRGHARGVALVGKTVDSSQNATSTGYYCITNEVTSVAGTSQMFFQWVRRAATAATSSRFQGGWAAGHPSGGGWSSSVDDNGDSQIALIYGAFKQIQPLLHVAVYYVIDVTAANTFSTTLFGSTAHTYLALGTSVNCVDGVPSTAFSLAMLWE